ncbi:hypothetical protein M9458_031468, partial [Cirrhinus mrigala]
ARITAGPQLRSSIRPQDTTNHKLGSDESGAGRGAGHSQRARWEKHGSVGQNEERPAQLEEPEELMKIRRPGEAKLTLYLMTDNQSAHHGKQQPA